MNFIMTFDKGFTHGLCDAVIERFNHMSGRHLASHVHYGNDMGNRKDSAYFLHVDDGDIAKQVMKELQECLDIYVENAPGLRQIAFTGYEVKVQMTGIGGGYHMWHCEQGQGSCANRILVWAAFLNDVAEGGELQFLNQNMMVKPLKGRVAIWPAAFTHMHRGNPPLSGEKFIATGWWHCLP